MKVFVAGATGAVGRPLVDLLTAGGHEVMALTRSEDRAAALREQGVRTWVGHALDDSTFLDAFGSFAPEVAVHQLTTFPTTIRPIKSWRMLRNTNRLRAEGARRLVSAAKTAGVRRVIAQSIAFLYQPADSPRSERDPIITGGRGILGGIARGIAEAEDAVLGDEHVEGVALRYGGWYGPGTQFPPDSPLRHLLRLRVVPAPTRSRARFNTTYIADAAAAVVAALEGPTGAFNIVDSDPLAVADLVAVAADAVGATAPVIRATAPLYASGQYMRHLPLHQPPVSNRRAIDELGWKTTHTTAADAIRSVFAVQS